MNERYLNELHKLHACKEAIDWASTQETPEKAWAVCERGEWMAWLCGKKYAGRPWSRKRKWLVLALCECARLALKYAKAKDREVIAFLKAVERWARGEATRQQIEGYIFASSASAAAYGFASGKARPGTYDYAKSAAAAAAYAAAAYASAFAIDAIDAAKVALYVHSAAFAASKAAGHRVMRSKPLKRCADIIRKYYPKPPKG